MAYTAFLVRDSGAGQSGYEKARADIRQLIERSEACATEGKINRTDYDMARFAVFAWIDEAVMSSSWEGRLQWQRELLQRQFYQTADAGELFFDRLNQVGLHQRDVREVYFVCLALGFTGQYLHAGDAVLLEGLKNENLKILTGSSVGIPSVSGQVLFPLAYAAVDDELQAGLTEESGGRGRFGRLSWMAAFSLAAPVVLYGFLFLVYRFVLSHIGDSFIQSVS
jgi:type VI secretion system protein ImpK